MNSPQNKVPPTLENPFFHRGPIWDRRYFYGRVKETRQALQMLRHGQCVSIVGPRRIGKTSLLFHLCDPEVQKGYGLREECLCVYIDCQSALGALFDRQQFYQWLWQEAKRALTKRGKAEGWAESISGFSGFREAMIMLQEKGYKPAFLFDEFDTIAKNLYFDKDLFSNLRSLVPTVTYATASHHSLYNLTYADRSVLSSPFFNLFSKMYLGFLRPKEAEGMVWGPLIMMVQGDLFTEEDLVFIFELGGYHPFFLQLACYLLFEQKMERRELAEADYESVRKHYTEQAEPHFRYAWRNMDAEEREAAIRLMCKDGVSLLNDEQKRRLERKCILYDNAIFSSVFAEFVQRQMAEAGTEKAPEAERRNALQRLAQLMQKRQDQGEPPYVLLLGSSLSLTPSLRCDFAGTEDWEAFWKEMQRASPTERKAMLKKPLDALGLEPGYHAIARLAEAGYFNLILTLNVDDAIDDAVRPLPADQNALLIYDGSNAAQIVEALSRATPRLKVVKLRGDINAQALPLTATGTFEFPEDLQQSVAERLKRDTILVGDIPYDDDVQRCIKRSTSALWCILPDEPASDSFVMRARQSRPPGEIITGGDAEFNAFFITLAEEVLSRDETE